jgi:hypothetical protein
MMFALAVPLLQARSAGADMLGTQAASKSFARAPGDRRLAKRRAHAAYVCWENHVLTDAHHPSIFVAVDGPL